MLGEANKMCQRRYFKSLGFEKGKRVSYKLNGWEEGSLEGQEELIREMRAVEGRGVAAKEI